MTHRARVAGRGDRLQQSRRPPSLLCTPTGTTTLPAGARHGLIHHMRQYPDVRLATASATARASGHPRAARAMRRGTEAGATSSRGTGRLQGRPRPRKPGDRSIHYFHAEYTKERGDRSALDPAGRRPSSSPMPPERRSSSWARCGACAVANEARLPRGPIVRWHSHLVCVGGRGAVRSRSPEARALPAHACARARRCSTSGSPATSVARSRRVRPRELCKAGPARPRHLLVRRRPHDRLRARGPPCCV